MTIDFKANKQEVDVAWDRLQDTAAETLTIPVDKEVRMYAGKRGCRYDHAEYQNDEPGWTWKIQHEGAEEVGYFDPPARKYVVGLKSGRTTTSAKEQEASYAAPYVPQDRKRKAQQGEEEKEESTIEKHEEDGEKKKIPNYHVLHNHKALQQVDAAGVVIQSFISMSEASRVSGKEDRY